MSRKSDTLDGSLCKVDAHVAERTLHTLSTCGDVVILNQIKRLKLSFPIGFHTARTWDFSILMKTLYRCQSRNALCPIIDSAIYGNLTVSLWRKIHFLFTEFPSFDRSVAALHKWSRSSNIFDKEQVSHFLRLVLRSKEWGHRGCKKLETLFFRPCWLYKA